MDECKRLFGVEFTPKDAKSVYSRMLGTDVMSTEGLTSAVARMSGYTDVDLLVDELLSEEEKR